MKLLVVLSLFTICYVSGEERPVTLCGRQLANARVFLCFGAEYLKKRGNDLSVIDNIIDDELEFSPPWEGRRSAIAARWSRFKRYEPGLVDQCCLRPCTKDVILNYC